MPKASCTVSDACAAAPALTSGDKVMAYPEAAAATTVWSALPVIELEAASVTISVCGPAVTSVKVTCATPEVAATLAGWVAAASLSATCSVPA